jgi:ABC-type transport system involved in multi-copper enzyme maturation permease subunit
MINLIRAEWLKLSRRPMAWVLLIIFLLLVILRTSSLFVLLGITDGTFTGGQLTVDMLREGQLEQFRRQLSFPGAFGDVLNQINGLGIICAVILAAGTLGNEYQWGTMRLQLSRQPLRGRYLVAKLIGLLLALLVGIVITMVVQLSLVLLCSSILGNRGSVQVGDVLLLPLGIARTLYVMLPYIMFTFAACTLGRSVMAGVAGGIIFLVIDLSVGALSILSEASNVIALLYTLLLQQNINTLVMLNSTDYGLDPSVMIDSFDIQALPSPLQATLVIAFYSGLFFGYAYTLITRRDVASAG